MVPLHAFNERNKRTARLTVNGPAIFEEISRQKINLSRQRKSRTQQKKIKVNIKCTNKALYIFVIIKSFTKLQRLVFLYNSKKDSRFVLLNRRVDESHSRVVISFNT